MSLRERFIAFGTRLFGDNAWHRIAFQPLLFTAIWAAMLRVLLSDTELIAFQPFPLWIYPAWTALGLICPPIGIAAWWLIIKSQWTRSALIGTTLRLSADLGIFMWLLAFHLASVETRENTDADVVCRYGVASVLLFMLLAVTRDIWVIAATGHAEKQLDRIRERV